MPVTQGEDSGPTGREVARMSGRRARKATSAVAWRLLGIVLTFLGLTVIGYCSLYLVRHFTTGWNPEGTDFANTTATLWLALFVFGVGPTAYGLNVVISGTRTGEPPPVEASARLKRTLAPGGSCSVAVTPDGQSVVSGSSDTTVRVWDLKSGRLLHTLEGHKKAVRAVVVTPDGRWAVSGSEDWTLRGLDASSLGSGIGGGGEHLGQPLCWGHRREPRRAPGSLRLHRQDSAGA